MPPRKVQTGGASSAQKGKAAEIRYNGKSRSKEDQEKLHKIVHSGDKTGKFAGKPNEFRDLTNSHDPKAEELLEKLKDKD